MGVILVCTFIISGLFLACTLQYFGHKMNNIKFKILWAFNLAGHKGLFI